MLLVVIRSSRAKVLAVTVNMALSAKARKSIPKSKMGMPGKATKKGGAVSGTYPMATKKQAAAAKKLDWHAGPAGKAKIDAKANRVLKGKGK